MLYEIIQIYTHTFVFANVQKRAFVLCFFKTCFLQ